MAKEGVENLVGKGKEVAGRVQEGAMAAVDRVNDFVCNVSDSLNGSACANATMNGTEMANDTIGETIDEDGEDADGEDADGEEAGDDGRRKLLDLTDAANAVTGAVSDASDAVTGAVNMVQDAISGAVGDAGDAPMNETAVANETMSMVDGVKDFVGNVSDCGLNATEEGNCTNATMPADGEMTGEEAGDDAGAVDDDGG